MVFFLFLRISTISTAPHPAIDESKSSVGDWACFLSAERMSICTACPAALVASYTSSSSIRVTIFIDWKSYNFNYVGTPLFLASYKNPPMTLEQRIKARCRDVQQ